MLGVGLTQITNVLARFESRNIHVDPAQCSRLRHKNSTCARCAEHCPEHAITWADSLKIDADQCSGCGICAAVCPTGALEASGPTNAELMARIEKQKGIPSLAFVCAKNQASLNDATIKVNCLGRLDESILMGAASWGIEEIVLVDGPCSGCQNAIGRSVCAQVVAECSALVRALARSTRISFAPQPPSGKSAAHNTPSADAALSRRAFFSVLSRETKVAAALTVSGLLESELETPKTPPKGPLPQRVPAKRQLLIQALHRLGTPSAVVTEMPGKLWATCHVKENCTGCQMCAFFCPTGALRKIVDQAKRALEFHAADCTYCGLCQEICFWQALDLAGVTHLERMLATPSEILTCPTRVKTYYA